MTRVFAALLWWALLLAAPAHAQNFPQPNNTRVVDAADIIPAGREAALDAKLKALEDNSTRQLAVATIPDLEGYDIADYGYRLGRAWGIGQQGENNGAMLIVAPNDRKVRIEVGYGLEPILTDAFSSVVINTQIVPRFKAGDYPGGVEAGVDALVTQLTLPPEEARKVAASAETPASDENWGAVIFWLFVLFFFILPALWPLFFGRRKRGKRYRGSGPIVVWGPGDWGSGGSSSWGGGGSSWGGGGFSGGGGSFGGGGASGGW
jgi:uncharacterized protein